MRLRVTAVEPHPQDHNRSVITMECEDSPIAVRQGLVVPGEEMEASRRGNSFLGSVRVQPRHDDLPPGPKRVINRAQDILNSERHDDTD